MQGVRKFVQDWWDAIIALGGAIVSGYDILAPFTTLGAIQNKYLLPISVGIFLIFGTISIFRSQRRLSAYKSTLPRLVAIGKPKWEPKGWEGNIWTWALGIEFRNIPDHASENSAALKVSATVRWMDGSGKIIKENHGRWQKTNRERDELKTELQTVDIYPNRQEKTLQFAKKSPDGRHFYAWGRVGDDSQEEIELIGDSFTVEITLFDSRGLSWPFKFSIINPDLPAIKVRKRVKTKNRLSQRKLARKK